jgi:predicted CopG family antitoxin
MSAQYCVWIRSKVRLRLRSESASISEVIPTLKKLKRQAKSISTLAAAATRHKLTDLLKKYYDGIEPTAGFRHIESDINYALATLLDPRFKNKFFCDETCANLAQAELVQLVKVDMTTTSGISTSRSKKDENDFFSDLHNDVTAAQQQVTGSACNGLG